MNDYGRYKRRRRTPQVAEVPSTLQPAETTNVTPISQSDNVAQHSAKDTGSEFDRAINEVFRLLPQELCPRPAEEQTSAKPLSGTEHLMKLHANSLLVLPQSKLVENTTKFLDNKLNSEKYGKDWLCSQSLVTSLAPTKFYKSQNLYFLTEIIFHQ